MRFHYMNKTILTIQSYEVTSETLSIFVKTLLINLNEIIFHIRCGTHTNYVSAYLSSDEVTILLCARFISFNLIQK